MRALKQVLNHGLKLKKVHRVIKFKIKVWLKLDIVMNTELRAEAKKIEIDFFKLMNNSVFGKTMEIVRNHRNIKLVTSDKRRKQLVAEPNYHSHKKFSEHLMAIEMKKKRVKMIKPIYLGMSILKCLCMNFGMTILNQSMEKEQNYAIQILIALLFALKLKIFLKIFLMMLRNGLIHLTTMKMMIDLSQ